MDPYDRASFTRAWAIGFASGLVSAGLTDGEVEDIIKAIGESPTNPVLEALRLAGWAS